MKFFQKLKKIISNQKFKKYMLILLFLFTIFSFYIASGIVNAVSKKNGVLVYEYMWIFLLFLPIPLLSVILGTIAKKRGYQCKKNIIGGIIVAILMLMYGTMSYDTENNNISTDYAYVGDLEEILSVDFPDTGKIELYSYSNINIINTFEILSKGYITFNNESEIEDFEQMLSTSLIWKNKNTSYMQMQEPREVMENIKGDPYYILYNKTENTYNVIPSKEGKYEMYYLIYDMDNNKIYMLNYNYTFIPE